MFAGVGSGAGTTTLATAMHGIDGGRWSGRPVDVLLCRSADLAHATAVPGASVLALRTGGTVAPAARAWLDRLRPRFGAIVLVPEVERWRALDEPPAAEAARLLAVPADRRPPELRPYADALLRITAALVHDGALTGLRYRPATPPGGTVDDPARPRSPVPRRRGRDTGPEPSTWSPVAGGATVHGPPGPRTRAPRAPGVPARDGGGNRGPDRPAPRALWRGLAPVERPTPARTDRPPVPGDLDDDALESPELVRSR